MVELLIFVQAEKDDKYDPQTKADRVAQSIIIGSLRKQFPQLKIIGEEVSFDSFNIAEFQRDRSREKYL